MKTIIAQREEWILVTRKDDICRWEFKPEIPLKTLPSLFVYRPDHLPDIWKMSCFPIILCDFLGMTDAVSEKKAKRIAIRRYIEAILPDFVSLQYETLRKR